MKNCNICGSFMKYKGTDKNGLVENVATLKCTCCGSLWSDYVSKIENEGYNIE